MTKWSLAGLAPGHVAGRVTCGIAADHLRVQCPVVTLARVVVRAGHFDEALVETQIVTN